MSEVEIVQDIEEGCKSINFPIVVKLSKEFLKNYDKLNECIGEEVDKGLNQTNNMKLYDKIMQAINKLYTSINVGKIIHLDMIPLVFRDKFEINNLRKIHLLDNYYLYYTISSTHLTEKTIQLLPIVLDFVEDDRFHD